MSGSGKPSLAGVLSGKSGSSAGPGNLYDKLGQLVDARTQSERLKPAVALVNAAGGETQGGGPIKSALEALKLGAELSASNETRQREADAAMASAQVESQKVRQDGELGAANMLLTAIQALKSEGGGGGGTSLEGIAAIIAAVAPLMQSQQQQGGSITLEGVAALMAAVQPKNDGGSEALKAVIGELRELRHEMKSGGGNQGLDGLLNAVKVVQGLSGADPQTRLGMRQLELQETLGLYEIKNRFGAQAAEAQANGELFGGLREVLKDGIKRSTDGGGGNAPQVNGAPVGNVIRCTECGHQIPFQGDPPEEIQCPSCEQMIRRRPMAS